MMGHELKRLDTELTELNAKASKVGSKYGKYYYQHNIFKEAVKHYLSARIMELRTDNPKASEAKLDVMARASKEYKDQLTLLSKDLKEAGRLKIQYEDAVREVESCRTRISLRKSEIERFGG